MIDWVRTGPSIIAVFLPSLVEFVEALTVVLAVGMVGGWRPALTSACLASGVLAALIVAFGPMLQAIPLNLAQLLVGVPLSAFGTFWTGEGIGIAWPGEDWSILAWIVGFLAAAGSAMPICRRHVI